MSSFLRPGRTDPDGIMSRVVVLLAVAMLVVAPIVVLAHEVLEEDESHPECRICEISSAEAMVLEQGPGLSVAVCERHPVVSQVAAPVADPAETPGTPRAPPS